ncbi:MAG: AAA family ATPase [Acholeplasmataceae bacterium]|nr:AAA family ATPase [Acholeplasmataceae bacterium]
MGERIFNDQNRQIVMMFNSKKDIWEDKTAVISAMYEAFQYGYYTGYDVYFKGTSKKYFYMDQNVMVLSFVKRIPLDQHVVMIKGKIIDVMKLDLFEEGYYRVTTESKVMVVKDLTLKSNKYQDIYNYYQALAAYAGTITNDDEPLHYLSKNYERIRPTEQSVLFQYLDGTYDTRQDTKPIIVPFDFNQSQYTAIEKALTNSISVIEGPPGTGKTQTILNLISNILIRNQNCAVVSNNNTAIENVYEKLTDEGVSFMAARLGRLDQVNQFFEGTNHSDLEAFIETELTEVGPNTLEMIKEDNLQIKRIQEIEMTIAGLNAELNDVIAEQKNRRSDDASEISVNERLETKAYLKLARRLERPKKIRAFERLLIALKYKVRLKDVDHSELLDKLETLFYERRIEELKKDIDQLERQLISRNKDFLIERLKKNSKNVLMSQLQRHYKEIELRQFTKHTFKSDYEAFLKHYPVILSTSHSVLNNAPSAFLFDYLIIDEASQGDLLSSVIAMSCARRVVIVGDSRQLQQIDEVRLFDQSEKLAKQYQVPMSYQYGSNSVLSSVRQSVQDVPITMLREHYRCAPDIINFCNRMFYDNELIPMTSNRGQHLEIIKTVPGNHGRKNPFGSGMYNQREIDVLAENIGGKDMSSVGVISPFRHQAERIRERFGETGIEADTIHKFQGRQKDEIYLSFVVNALDVNLDQEKNLLHDFVTNRMLLNVAISRGKNKVTAIVSDKIYHSKNNIIHDFIQYAEHLYGNSITKTSNLTSVFDYLYAEYDDLLKKQYKSKPKEHMTELLMCNLIDEVLKEYKTIGYSMHVRLSRLINNTEGLTDEERRYVMHPWTHVDFLFFKKVSKERLFVIEVDGIKFHEQSQHQSEHDRIKDAVLRNNGIPVHRFKTNESSEEQRLIKIFQDYTY